MQILAHMGLLNRNCHNLEVDWMKNTPRRILMSEWFHRRTFGESLQTNPSVATMIDVAILNIKSTS